MATEHIMIDIETMGTRPNSVVLSIGAVKFDPKAEPGTFGEEFYAVLDTEQQEKFGRVKDAATVKWWSQQSIDAVNAVFGVDKQPLDYTIDSLFDYIGIGSYFIWGNGADFDNVIVADLFRTCGREVPWAFWNNRCFRTWKSEFKHLAAAPKFAGIKHHALHDAQHQAEWCQRIHQKLNKIGAIV